MLKQKSSKQARSPQAAEVSGYLLELCDEMGEGVALCEGARFVYVNKALCRMYGYTENELLSLSSFVDLVPLKEQKRVRADLRKLPQKNARARRGKTIIIRKDGSRVCVEYSVRNIEGHSGKLLLAVMRDITERIRMEEGFKRMHGELKGRLIKEMRKAAETEALLGSIGEGVIAIDERGRVVFVNKKTEELIGWKSGEMIGTRLADLLVVLDENGNPVPYGSRASVLALEKREPVSMSGRSYVRKDRTVFPVASTAAPVLINGKPAGVIIVFRDVTREREMELAKNEFVSLASHQLRTPLSTINWYTETLLEGKVVATTNELGKGYMREIYNASRRMARLVNELLNVSRLEMGTLTAEVSSINISHLAENTVQEIAPQITQKELDFTLRVDQHLPYLYFDASLTKMILQNLISNAVKYTPSRGRVEVVISSCQQTAGSAGRCLLISVSDSGIGIPSLARRKVFTKFFRADNVKEVDADGTGLGLYMVKSIVELAQGRIWFDSREHRGTTFYVQLPFRQETSISASP